MKKFILLSVALAVPALASAQVTLMSGYNFGQFLGAGFPSLDGTTGDAVGSIGANWGPGSTAPATSTSGEFVGNNGLTGGYSNGTGRLYWDGTGTSGVASFTSGNDLVAAVNPSAAIFNGNTVDGVQMALIGDNSENLGLLSQTQGNRLAFVQNTVGFTAPATSNDLTFAAKAFGSPVTIQWFFNGSSAGSTVVGTEMAAYSLNLDPAFYGQSGATLVGQIGGSVLLDNVQFNGQVIPEPSTYAALLGAITLGVVAIRSRKKKV